MKRILYRMFMRTRLTQQALDENEFLSDMDKLRAKWTMRGQTEYANGVKAVISEFTNPGYTETQPDFIADNMKVNKNIVT